MYVQLVALCVDTLLSMLQYREAGAMVAANGEGNLVEWARAFKRGIWLLQTDGILVAGRLLWMQWIQVVRVEGGASGCDTLTPNIVYALSALRITHAALLVVQSLFLLFVERTSRESRDGDMRIETRSRRCCGRLL